jgi:tight adherence protein C
MALAFLSLVALTVIPPKIFVPLLAFFAITAGVWWLATATGGVVEEPTVEDRLDKMRGGPRNDPEERKKKKFDKMAAMLEKATAPLAGTVATDQAQLSKLSLRMINAGYRRESAPVIFKGLQAILGGVGLFLGGIVGLLSDGFSTSLLMKAIIAGGIGYYIPELVPSSKVKKRKLAIFLGLPDALDLMVVCVEAGLGLDQAMRKVADELVKSHPIVAEEFKIANHQLQLGQSRSQVLKALGDRSGVDDLQQLASILIQADKFGSSVGTALRVQSETMRTQRMQIAEEKAAKTAVKMLFPLVFFIFPGIFVVLCGPAAISIYRIMILGEGGDK